MAQPRALDKPWFPTVPSWHLQAPDLPKVLNQGMFIEPYRDPTDDLKSIP